MDEEEARAEAWRMQRHRQRVFAAQMRASLIPSTIAYRRVSDAFRPIRDLIRYHDQVQPKDEDSDRFNFGIKEDEAREGTTRVRVPSGGS